MNAPLGSVIKWIWNNAVGQRELYSNYTDIDIEGRNGGFINGVESLHANYGPDSIRIPEFDSPNSPEGSEVFA
ncbi:hypothetical protein BG011_002366 [Mortierella polycephala]|uniref:Uncharacterized protein n=1 Tax=Mortierella polycephala TaxID=41804 RepID=A0A9P6Q6Y2_9FUNG|nr:hypothetical protein BG011_002366 [Mortierella polycephala]